MGHKRGNQSIIEPMLRTKIYLLPNKQRNGPHAELGGKGKLINPLNHYIGTKWRTRMKKDWSNSMMINLSIAYVNRCCWYFCFSKKKEQNAIFLQDFILSLKRWPMNVQIVIGIFGQRRVPILWLVSSINVDWSSDQYRHWKHL